MPTPSERNFCYILGPSSKLPNKRPPELGCQKRRTKWHRSRRKCDIELHERLKEIELKNCDDCDKSACKKRASMVSQRGGNDDNLFKRKLFYLINGILILTLATNGLTNCLVINVGRAEVARSATSERQQQPQQRQNENKFSAKLMQAESLDALAYLQRYGYMNGTLTNSGNLISEDSFQEAIVSFQRFAGIPETGSIDSMTVKYMQMPRCGNRDQSGKGENGRRKKRYALQGSKWKRQELTYRISQYPTRFLYKRHEVDSQIEKAFKIWSQVAPIDFVVKKEGRVHIDIKFANGEHGDGDPFDGPGNTLAHAYFPQYGGDAHFDDQEYWTVDSYTGTNIFQVAAHELGHSLGLGHSSVREALMAPFYQKYKPNFKLHTDDVLGIQALYGERSASDDDGSPVGGPESSSTTEAAEPRRRPSFGGRTTSTTTTSTTTTQAPPSGGSGNDDDDNDGGFFGFGSGSGSKPADLCVDSSIDAITRTEDGNTYVFRGAHYWQIKNEGLASGYPARISKDWDGLPGNLDAALTWSDGKTFFFKGDKYWRFFNKKREPGYPKQISAGFAGIPNNIDAAFVWSGNGKTYFFKKDKYWRFDSKQEPPVSSQYPKSIKNWSGLPTTGIDGAFKWENGMTYFFKDDVYYRFDDREFEVDSSARPAFPRQTAEWWFGCTNSNLPIKKRPQAGGSNELLDSAASSSSPDFFETPLTSSLLMFHRKPNLSYDNLSENKQPTTTPKPSGGGSSISRSLLSSLSSLFPSSFQSAPAAGPNSRAPNNSQTLGARSLLDGGSNEEWSFHRGVGEEVSRRRVAKSAPEMNQDQNLFGIGQSRRPSIDTSRWLFPTSGHSREQSSSELNMAPEVAESTSLVDGRATRRR